MSSLTQHAFARAVTWSRQHLPSASFGATHAPSFARLRSSKLASMAPWIIFCIFWISGSTQPSMEPIGSTTWYSVSESEAGVGHAMCVHGA